MINFRIIHRFYLVGVLVLLLAASSLEAQEAMSLEKAISLGLENNFKIKVGEQNIRIASNNNTWARTGRTPTVDLNGVFSNTMINDNNEASFLNGAFYNGSLGASLDGRWTVFNGGRFQIAKKQLEQLVGQQEVLQSAESHNLIREIVQRYYEVLFQKERLEVLTEVHKLSQYRLQYEQTKQEFGASNSYNLIQFQSAILTDSTNLVNQRVQIEIAKRNLYNVLDLSGFPNYNFLDRLSVEPEQINSEKLKETLSEENYTLKSLMVIQELDQLNSELESVSGKPTISLSGTLGFSEGLFKFFKENPATGEQFKANFNNRLNLGVNANLNWNLYDGGVRKQNQQNAKIQEEISELNFLEATAELNNQLDILLTNYQLQLDLLKLTDDQIALAKRNMEMTDDLFKAGRVTSLDYRTIQNQYLNAAFNKVNAIYNLIITKSEIDWLTGRFVE